MTKERKEFILSVYRNYDENKKLVKFLSVKVLSDGEKEYYELLKKKVEAVDKILSYAEMESLEKRKFVEECLIKNYTQNRVVFDCFLSPRTFVRWKQRFIDLMDNCLVLYGI